MELWWADTTLTYIQYYPSLLDISFYNSIPILLGCLLKTVMSDRKKQQPTKSGLHVKNGKKKNFPIVLFKFSYFSTQKGVYLPK